MSTAGDFNGDGYGDFVVGAYGNDDGGSRAGAAYVLLGGATPGSDSLSAADCQYQGSAVDELAGFAVAGGGDVNGDTFADIVIGARWNSAGGARAGAAYLILGSAAPTSGSLASGAATYTGEAANDDAGWAVALAGDVNGDGLDEVLVGAEQNSGAASGAGAAYVLFGSASPGSVPLSGADVTLTGAAPFDAAGVSVAGVGDVNADGFGDLLVGAYVNDDGGYQAGAAYLVLGGSSLPSRSLAAADATYDGVASGDYAGWSVAGAGDVDADGFEDMMVRAYYAGYSYGASYVILGATSPFSHSLATADFTYVAEGYGDMAGYALAGAGDVNSDGFDDILIGAPWNQGAGDPAGAAYLIIGAP